MTGPEGNSEFCFLESQYFPRSPRDQSLSVNCFHKWTPLSFWYYAITTMYFLPKRERCKESCEFWKHVFSWLGNNGILFPLVVCICFLFCVCVCNSTKKNAKNYSEKELKFLKISLHYDRWINSKIGLIQRKPQTLFPKVVATNRCNLLRIQSSLVSTPKTKNQNLLHL